jgi:hypothetical protein
VTVAEPSRTPQAQGRTIELEDAEPANEAVEGPKLFDGVVSVFVRYMVLPPGAAVSLALWVALTYLSDAVETMPRLLLSSPTRECGKSRLLSLLAALVRRPLPAVSLSPSSLFRIIEASEPTMLLDEVDNARLDDAPELRAILNSGHTRGSAWTVRTVGENHEPKKFSTWAPVALAGIGKFPDTITSRCAPRIPMRRRSAGERIEKFRESRINAEMLPVRRRLARWAMDHAQQVRTADR